MRLGPSFQDWLFASFTALLALCGLLIAWVEGERAGFAVFNFFGACTAVGVWVILRKRRIRIHAAVKDVKMPGFTPLRARRSSRVAWTARIAAVGFGMWATGSAFGTVVVAIGAGLAVLGTLLSIGIVLDVLPGPYLQFEPAGLRMGQRRYSFLIEWENMARVAPVEMHSHDHLLVEVHDIDRLHATLHPGPVASDRLAKLIRSNRTWFGADVAIMTMQYGTDVALLGRAVARYAGNPGCRGELEPRCESPHATGRK